MIKPANPFRYFDSSPEVIRLMAIMYVRYLHQLETRSRWTDFTASQT